MSQHREIFSNPSSQQSSSKFKRGIKFLQGAKVELHVHHYSSTPLFPLTSYILHHFHYISTQPIFRITHVHILIWLYGQTCPSGSMFWLCNKCSQVWIPCLPTYELHISLLEVERREKAHTINALVRIQKYHRGETWEGHTRESLSFIWKSCKKTSE
jgi:hypothetical protein